MWRLLVKIFSWKETWRIITWSVLNSAPVSMSHILAVVSILPVATIVLCGLKDKQTYKIAETQTLKKMADESCQHDRAADLCRAIPWQNRGKHQNKTQIHSQFLLCDLWMCDNISQSLNSTTCKFYQRIRWQFCPCKTKTNPRDTKQSRLRDDVVILEQSTTKLPVFLTYPYGLLKVIA